MRAVRVRGWLIAGLLLALLAPPLAACGASTAPGSSATATPPVATAAPVTTPSPAPTPSPTPRPSPAPSPTPSPSPAASPAPVAGALEVPGPGDRVTLPLHILAHLPQPAEQVTATLRWKDGTSRRFDMPVQRASDGTGLVIGTPPWWPDVPPQPKTQPATLELRAGDGALLASQAITVLDPSDPGVQSIQLFWTVSGGDVGVVAETRAIPRTPQVGAAALRELLWGPPPVSQIGYSTALPLPAAVLAFPGREPDWGSRVELLGLTIEDGVATANFSKELAAYGGGSTRVMLIRKQITQTLLQFPSIHEVRIAIAGQTEGVLEP